MFCMRQSCECQHTPWLAATTTLSIKKARRYQRPTSSEWEDSNQENAESKIEFPVTSRPVRARTCRPLSRSAYLRDEIHYRSAAAYHRIGSGHLTPRDVARRCETSFSARGFFDRSCGCVAGPFRTIIRNPRQRPRQPRRG